MLSGPNCQRGDLARLVVAADLQSVHTAVGEADRSLTGFWALDSGAKVARVSSDAIVPKLLDRREQQGFATSAARDQGLEFHLGWVRRGGTAIGEKQETATHHQARATAGACVADSTTAATKPRAQSQMGSSKLRMAIRNKQANAKRSRSFADLDHAGEGGNEAASARRRRRFRNRGNRGREGQTINPNREAPEVFDILAISNNQDFLSESAVALIKSMSASRGSKDWTKLLLRDRWAAQSHE